MQPSSSMSITESKFIAEFTPLGYYSIATQKLCHVKVTHFIQNWQNYIKVAYWIY